MKLLSIFKCEVCGNIVEMAHVGGGVLVCCNAPMKLQEEKTADKATEKHVPLIEKIDGGVKVTVGSTLHPMVEDHYIEWIELICESKGYVARKHLKAGDEPIAIFPVRAECQCEFIAREYCNKHGLWKS